MDNRQGDTDGEGEVADNRQEDAVYFKERIRRRTKREDRALRKAARKGVVVWPASKGQFLPKKKSGDGDNGDGGSSAGSEPNPPAGSGDFGSDT